MRILDSARTTRLLGAIFLLAAVSARATGDAATADLATRLNRVLSTTPLIDGHNDLPWEIRQRFKGRLSVLDLTTDTAKLPVPEEGLPLMTDIPRLRAGRVGAQFWSVYVPVDLKGSDAVQATLEQIDLVKEMIARYPSDLQMAFTAKDIRRIHQAHRIASLIGVEGGHQINNSLSVLRQYYALGARYMTLTHTSNVEWADSATDTPAHHGLTAFGAEVVHEMNRLGMLVDLSHVSAETMKSALAASQAPVIFSHSSARALVDHPRDVPDDVLRLVATNGGVVMVNFYPGYVSEQRRRWASDRAAEQARVGSLPYAGLYVGQPEKVKAAIAAWDQQHPKPAATLGQVADHIEHIRQVAGVEHVGLGSDFDGIDEVPEGLGSVDKYPALLAELMRRGWSDKEVAAVAGENLLRALAAAEEVSRHLSATHRSSEAVITPLDAPAAPKR